MITWGRKCSGTWDSTLEYKIRYETVRSENFKRESVRPSWQFAHSRLKESGLHTRPEAVIEIEKRRPGLRSQSWLVKEGSSCKGFRLEAESEQGSSGPAEVATDDASAEAELLQLLLSEALVAEEMVRSDALVWFLFFSSSNLSWSKSRKARWSNSRGAAR